MCVFAPTASAHLQSAVLHSVFVAKPPKTPFRMTAGFSMASVAAASPQVDGVEDGFGIAVPSVVCADGFARGGAEAVAE